MQSQAPVLYGDSWRLNRVPPLNASAFVEKVLERDGPIWCRWDRDLVALQNALTAAAYDLSSFKPTGQAEISEFAVRQEGLLWLLDRLAPDSEGRLFEQHLNHPRGIYAWGRRLPPERRGELIRFPIPSGQPGNWGRQMVWQALVYAWCDSCPYDQLNSLIQELGRWLPALDRHEGWYLGDPIEEFYRRCTDERRRWEQLAALLQKNLVSLKDQDETARNFAHDIAWRAWSWLLRDTALASPRPEAPPHREEDWDSWFVKVLSLPEFSRVADLGRDLLDTRPSLKSIAQSLWLWRHGKSDWQQLYFSAGRFLNDFWISARFLDRLAEIVPPDKLDIWDGLVMSDSNFDRIHAFCRWLPAHYAEVLRDHFNHPDRDWGACAFQNYLAKTPEPILQHWFRLMDDLPRWQVELLDRRLFAPERVRPSTVLEDIQSVEGDFRLQDPFNHRHY